MSKRVKRLPEDFLLKVSLGLTCEFKFKSTEANFSVNNNLILLEQLPDSGWTILGNETIDSVNLFLSSGRYFHWHVDTGVRNQTQYFIGKRYAVPAFRSIPGIDPA